MSNCTTDLNNLTFSQAAGIDPLPRPARLGELPTRVRNTLWSSLYRQIYECNINDFVARVRGILSEPWYSIVFDYSVSILNIPSDEFNGQLDTQLCGMKKLFLHGAYNRVFDFLQFVMRHELVPNGFREVAVTILKQSMCAYSIVEDVWTIVPAAIPEQRMSIEALAETL